MEVPDAQQNAPQSVSVPDDGPPVPSHPSDRYSRTNDRLEGLSRVCSKTIYAAFDNERCTEVAWIEYSNVPRTVFDKFEDYLTRLLKLDHPNLVRKSRSCVFISEQLTSDLRNLLLKKMEMAPKVYVRWINQMASALHYLHQENWAGRVEIRSSNVFIRGNGDVKIGGLAEALFSEVHFADKAFQVGITAPEVATGTKQGAQQDVYQLGLCALQAFTFHHPYRGCNLLQQLYREQYEGKKPPELAAVKDKDPRAADLISRCLEPIESRITMDEVLKHPYLTSVDDAAGKGVEVVAEKDVFLSPEAVKQDSAANIHQQMGSVAVSLAPKLAEAAAPAPEAPAAQPKIRFLKCFIGPRSPEASCIRVRLNDVTSVAELKSVIESEFNEQLLFPVDLSLRYRDTEGDLVLITQRTELEDILEFAECLELHPSKASAAKSGALLLGDLLDTK